MAVFDKQKTILTIDNWQHHDNFCKTQKENDGIKHILKKSCQIIREPQWKCRTFAVSKGEEGSPPPAIPSLAEDFCFGRSGLLTFSQSPESSLPRGGEMERWNSKIENWTFGAASAMKACFQMAESWQKSTKLKLAARADLTLEIWDWHLWGRPDDRALFTINN